MAVLAPWIAPYDPVATSWSLVRKPPSALNWFGTDDLGRDILSRVIYGARASLVAGAISVGVALGIGVPFGLLSGYRGGFDPRALPQKQGRGWGPVPARHPGRCAHRGLAQGDPHFDSLTSTRSPITRTACG